MSKHDNDRLPPEDASEAEPAPAEPDTRPAEDAPAEADEAPADDAPETIRRVGARDRKQRIKATGPLFPPEVPLPETPDRDEAIPEDHTPFAPPADDAPTPDDPAWGDQTPPADDPAREDDWRARIYEPPPPDDRFPPTADDAPTAPVDPRAMRRPRAACAPAPRRRRFHLQDLIALLFALASCGVIVYVAYLWQNPYSELNPLAPPTPLPLIVSQTPTPTETPTPSPTPTISPTPTETSIPSITPSPSVAPSATFTPLPLFGEGGSASGQPLEGLEPGEASDYPFVLVSQGVIYITNPEARGGCNWASIAGSVTDLQGQALNGYGIHIIGEGIDEMIASGSSPGYGPGGFEWPLGTTARDAQYTVQLIDPTGTPLSDAYKISTRSDCQYNIAAVRFVQTTP